MFGERLLGESRWSKVLRPLLYLCSKLYQGAISLRHLAFDLALCSAQRAPLPVICVGNISVGGTGKTPLVIEIAKRLSAKRQVAISTRGYRSLAEKFDEPTCVSLGNGPLCTAKQCGDEPYLMAKKLSGVHIWAGKNRMLAAKVAKEKGAEILLLDDGMQHRKLQRDHDVCVVDADSPLSNGHFLPRGRLRDLPKRLKSASLIVINHVRSWEHFEEARYAIAKYSAAPCAGMRFVIDDLERFKGIKLALFCGLGNPQHFVSAIEEAGATIVEKRLLGDHRFMASSELAAFAQRAKEAGADRIVCTEKDWVKIEARSTALPIDVARGGMRIVYGERELERIFDDND